MAGEARPHRSTRKTRGIAAATRLAVLAWSAMACGSTPARAEDWPAYGHDIARSGITSENILPPLGECWALKLRHPPEPAWGNPKPEKVEDILELRRVHFDDVFQPVACGGAVFFGSSANNKVYCVAAATGRIRWTYITGGPVRLAPTVVGGRVYFGSDDGYAYCLGARDGAELWKFRAAPEDRRVLGHGKMISLWPLRCGVLVDGGTAYFSAGIFPAEGVFLYALDARSGREIWRNDTCGELPQSRVSPQGYLLASKSALYVPMGRVSPAAFDRPSGRLLYETFFGKTVGGTYALLAGERVYTGTEEILAYNPQAPRDRFAKFPGRKMVVAGKAAYLATDTELTAIDRKQPAAAPRWKTASTCCESLILAGSVLYAGGPDQVIAVDAAAGKLLWSAKVEGAAKGLAVADGRLLVSTDKGIIYCFAPADSPKHDVITEPVDRNGFPASQMADTFRQAADTILKETGINRGYCLVLGLETGELALELAKRSDLRVYAVSPDAGKVAAVRKSLDAAGLYGSRVCVEQWPLEKVPYADYFADLIVSETAIAGGELPASPAEMFRMLKPLRGVAMIGQPAQRANGAQPLQADALRKWLADSRLEGGRMIADRGAWVKITRGPLPGAGQWTHQYADAGNTACGDDTRLKAPLGVLWFGNPGPEKMVPRHERAAGPLSLDGRLFIQGDNVVMAYDAYNGLPLWQREIFGALRHTVSHDCSNLAVNREGLFVAVGDKCLRLDPATGQTKATYQVPPESDKKPQVWGYVACTEELLFGSRTTNRRQSDCLFAVDVQKENIRWSYQGKQIPHNTIAIGDGTVFLLTGDATTEQRQQAIEEARAREKSSAEPRPAATATKAALAERDVRLAVALDAKTGKLRWTRPVDLTDCGNLGGKSGILAAMYHNGVLLLFGVHTDGHYWQQFFRGEFAWRRIVALSSADGKMLWSRPVGFRVRPLVIGDTLHAEPWAFDLRTGEPRMRVHPVTGQPEQWQFARPGHHCGCPVASPNCLFFRSYDLGYYDLLGDYGTMHFGAQRPGCWVNAIPAGGLLLMPEASAGCMCPFPNMCSIVFQPVEQNKAWAYFSAPGPMTPVGRLALNLGASGDRKDTAGNLWLGYPRPAGSLVLRFTMQTAFYPTGGFARNNSVYDGVAGTNDPWLFASAANGLRRCVIPLVGTGDGKALYRVRLAFADPENDRPGVRFFDVKLQGKTVAENFDVAAAAGARNRAVFREFNDIEVNDKLLLELVSPAAKPTPRQWPILQGIEIVRQRVIGIGCLPPEFVLGSLAPRQAAEISLSNLREEPFAGTLQLTAPEGFDVTPKRAEVKLAAGEHMKLPVEATVKEGTPAGDYRLGVRLARGDGKLELERTARIEHLGPRGRLVLKAVEDAYVQKRYPDRNRGTSDVLLVDGGDAKSGDLDHSLAYLKFRLEVPGKPLRARLRLCNAGNPSENAGRVCLAVGPWKEKEVTYQTRPAVGKEIARLGRVEEYQVVDCPLHVELVKDGELSLVIDPTSLDGVDYVSRKGKQPPELIVDYEP